MGGSIFVGVRTSKEIILTNRWTNSTSWELADPDFYDENSCVFKAWVSRANNKDKFNNDKCVKTIRNPAYGFVLIDLVNKAIWSENSYWDPSRLSIAVFSTAFEDELDILNKLEVNGWLGKLWAGAKYWLEPMSEFERSVYINHAASKDFNWFNDNQDRQLFCAEILHKGYDVKHQVFKSIGATKRAKEWAKAQGWNL